jgi:tetratricopeptide (TPR) repeat protein
MKCKFLTCLAVVVIMPCQGMGATASANVTSPAEAVIAAPSGQNSSSPAPDDKTKVTAVGMLCPTENEQAMRLYNDALQLQQQGRLLDSEAAYLKAIELDPRYCDAMDNLGQMLRSVGDTKQAISWYTRSLSVKPDNVVAHQDLAVAYRVQGDINRSQTEYRWLIQNDPVNPEGYYGLGMTCLDSGQTQAAIEPLERAAQMYRANSSPLLADAQYLLGVAFFMQKEYRKAKDYFVLSYPQRKEDPNTNYLLGLCYLDPSIGDHAQAKQYLLKAQKLGVRISAEVLRELGK